MPLNFLNYVAITDTQIQMGLLAPMLLLGLKVWHHLHDKIDQQRFNAVINVLLSSSEVMLMLKSWAHL